MIKNKNNTPTFELNEKDIPLTFEITCNGQTAPCDLLSLTGDSNNSKLDWFHQDIGIIEQHYVKLSEHLYHIRLNIIPMTSAMVKMKQIYSIEDTFETETLKDMPVLYNENFGLMTYHSSSVKNNTLYQNNEMVSVLGANASIVLSANKLFSINGLLYLNNEGQPLNDVLELFKSDVYKEKESCKS